MLNHIDIMGRMTADPELRMTNTQKSVCSFRIACDRDTTGEQKCDFVGVVTWGQTAEFVSKYFTKGTMVAVSGRLQMRDWTDRNGNKKTEAEIVADRVYFGERKAKDEPKFEPVPDTEGLPF